MTASNPGQSGPPLSDHRTHGEWVYISGQIGREPDGRVPEDFTRQAELAIQALRTQLEAAGSSLDRVIKTTVFITSAERYAVMNAVYARHFQEPWPTRSTLVTGLALPELQFEIEAVGYRGDAR